MEMSRVAVTDLGEKLYLWREDTAQTPENEEEEEEGREGREREGGNL